MAYGQSNQNNGNYKPQVKTNRFGDPEVLITLQTVVDKKSGECLPIFKSYVELGGQLYKIEVSNRNKETKSGNPAMWCKITKRKKEQFNRSQTM